MTAPPERAPRVGVGVLVLRGRRVLLGQRQGAHGAGHWALPGGHLEFGESVEDGARRELLEETGLHMRSCRPGPYTNDVFQVEGRHYVTLFMLAEVEPGEPRLLEPDRCRGWGWFEWDHLPQPLFQPLHTLWLSGYVPMGPTENAPPAGPQAAP